MLCNSHHNAATRCVLYPQLTVLDKGGYMLKKWTYHKKLTANGLSSPLRSFEIAFCCQNKAG
jgi:hypothetical protein